MPKSMKYDKLFDKKINGVQPNIKERFLNTIAEPTRGTARYILGKAYKIESVLNKDIYEFSFNEIDSLIRIYSNRSMQSVATNVSCLRDYINFCIREGFTHDMVNYLESVGGEDYLKKYIDVRATENKYVTRERLSDIESRLENARDIAIIELLFVGLTPEEIINLKVSDCNFIEKTLTLIDNNRNKRILDNLTEITINIIKYAINENEYTVNNGVELGLKDYHKGEIQKLYNPEFVIKNTRQSGFVETSLTNLVARIKIWTDEPYLTPTNIKMSGIIDYAKKIKEENGSLEYPDIKYIMKRFNYTTITHGSAYDLKRKIIDYI